MSVEITLVEGVKSLHLNMMRLDAKSSPGLVELMSNELGAEDHVMIDLANLQFIDSTGLGAILKLLKLLEQRGKLVLYGMEHRAVRDIFRMTRLYKTFTICDSQQQALAELQN